MSETRVRGASLLHLILLLTGMTVLASVAIPTWFGRADVTLVNAAQLLAKDLRDAQDRAAFQHSSLRLSFAEDGDGYSVVDAHGVPVHAPVGRGVFKRRFSRDAVFRGVRVVEVEVGPENAVHFGPRGMALNGGRVVLAYRGERRQLEIEPTTGRIAIDGTTFEPR